MVHVLPLNSGANFGHKRAFGRTKKDCEMGPRTRHLDKTIRGHHDKDNRTDGASTCRSP
jgi:hypothetical protein